MFLFKATNISVISRNNKLFYILLRALWFWWKYNVQQDVLKAKDIIYLKVVANITFHRLLQMQGAVHLQYLLLEQSLLALIYLFISVHFYASFFCNNKAVLKAVHMQKNYKYIKSHLILKQGQGM